MSAENDAPRPGYWAVVPAAVRYDDRIPASSKVLYAELSALAQEDGYCWADNAYFARVFRLTEKSVRQQLHALEDAGYIRIEEERERHRVLKARRIYVGLNPLLGKSPRESLEEKVPSLEEKVQRHFIENNNIPPISPRRLDALKRLSAEVGAAVLTAAGEDAALLEAWLDFLEMRRGKHTPVKTARTVQLLARKLETLSGGDATVKQAILEQSVEQSWTGLFALKDERGAALPPSKNGENSATQSGGRDSIRWI